jgi:hypothetical protein
MASAAVAQNLSAIAFTDHIDIHGTFRYAKHVRGTFADYFCEIESAREFFPHITIASGIEVSQEFAEIPPEATSVFAQCDLVLIDGFTISNAICRAVQICEYCEQMGYDSVLVGVAHPRYELFTRDDFERLVNNPVFLELNNSKIKTSPWHGTSWANSTSNLT